MKPKKTFSERLANRYRLVVRNEETLAEHLTFVFTYARVMIVLILLLGFFLALGIALSKTILAKWFDPQYAQVQLDKKMHKVATQLDSLTNESKKRENFIENLQYVFGSDSLRHRLDHINTLTVQDAPVATIGSMELTPLDSQFRSDFEQSELAQLEFDDSEYSKLKNMFLFPPIEGFISSHYDLQKEHYGIDIIAKANESVKAIADGTVLLATWTQQFGYILVIQHTENLISMYRYNSNILEKSGNFVSAGSVIAMIEAEKEHVGVPHLYFELWYNGIPLNPEEFINF